MNNLSRLVFVWKALGWSSIVMIMNQHNPTDLVKLASSRGVEVSIINQENYWKEISRQINYSHSLPHYVFTEPVLHFEEFKNYLNLFRRPYSSMLVTQLEQSTNVNISLSQLQQSSGFFEVVLTNDSNVLLYRIQTLINGGKYVREQWQLNDLGQYAESYNMQGLTVTTIALSWAPWLVLDESCQDSDECQHSGYLVEVMDAVGKICNFTWNISVEADGIWGDTPVNREDGLQPHDFRGVFGGVVNRKYDVALSNWIYFYERSLFVDYSSAVSSTQRVLIFDGRMIDDVDFTIFLRPFTRESRYALVLFTLIITMTMIVFSKTCSGLASKYPTSAKVIALSAWTYFILVQAYYGGALTMFFSSGMSKPFETLREGLEDPNWDFIVQRGTEARMLDRAKDGDKPFVEWVKRSKTKGLLVPTMHEVYSRLQEGKYFTLSEIPRLANYLHNNPMPGFVPKTIRHKWHRDSMLVVGKNSPVTTMLNSGLTKLRQSGLLDRIMAKYNKRLPGVSSQNHQETMTLGGQQVVSVFVTGGLVMCVVLVLLLVEILFKKLSNVSSRTMDSQ